MKYIVLILISFLLFGCADVKRPEQLESIDEITSKVDQMLDVYETIDTSLLREMQASSIDLGKLLESFSGDTLPNSIGVSIDQVYHMGKQSVYLQVELNEVQYALRNEHDILNALRNDIEKGSGRRDKYDENIEFENRKIDTLSKRFNQCIKFFDNAKKVYIDQYPNLIVELEERLSIKEQLLIKEE